MAAGRSITGALDMKYWNEQLANAKNQQAAIKVVSNMMDAANWLGISDKDQKNVLSIIEAYEKKYSVDMSRVKKIWDPSQNHINSLEYGSSNYKKMWEEIANDPDIFYTGESVDMGPSIVGTMDAVLNPTPQNIQKAQAANNAYKEAVTNGVNNSSIPSSQLPDSMRPNTATNNNTNSGTGGGTTINYTTPAYDDSALKKQLSDQNKMIQDLLDQVYELQHPKVYTAQELAEHYDVADMYNVDYWNNLYDKATNEYYDNATKEQNNLRTDYAFNNGLYVDNLMSDYLKSYKNAAPTAASRGAMAANALSAQALQGVINSESDYGMLQSINQLNEDRKAELAENKNSALQAYQNMGTYLMQLGADHNKSDVTDYTNTLNNLSTKYAASRQYSSSLADAAATRYAGLAQAAKTNAATAASSFNNQLYNQLFNMYNVYGGKRNTAYLNSIGYGN